jgi:hypothetical protein
MAEASEKKIEVVVELGNLSTTMTIAQHEFP